MFDLLQKMFGKEPAKSKDIAKERLRLVLVHDRVNVSPQFMEVLKEDMIKVISNYMEINEKEMEVNLTQTHTSQSRWWRIPGKPMKRGVLPAE
jgi:cell division topological specificity factor